LTSISPFLIAYKNHSKSSFFGQKKFFLLFSTLISKIFSRIFFSRHEFWSSDVFKTIFRKNTFLNIFLNTKSKNVRFSQDTLFLMLFKKKWLNLKKKVILALFLENRFLVDFRKIENFLGSRYPNIFFYQFPISQTLNYSFMQKKL
jgi:hypothetical protein